MPTFYYKAKKGPQDVVESTIEAKTKEEAVLKIGDMGYVPVKVAVRQGPVTQVKVKSDKPKPLKNKDLNLRLFQRVKSRDVTIFIEQLASLIRSKIPVFEAVNILAAQTENPGLKKIISSISLELKDGKTFSESLRNYPHVFSHLFINMVHSGETGGVLEETLNRLAEFRQEEEDLKAKVTAAMVYPLFIMAVGLLTIFILLTFGVPRLTLLFTDMGQVLPLPTRILISVSRGIRDYWHWGLLLISFLVFIIKQERIIEKNRLVIDNFKLRLPLFGRFLKQATLARFSRTFATLLSNGVPVLQALNITIPSLENNVFKKELEQVKEDVISGGSFAQGMKKCIWFPSFVVNMIAVSEKRGDLKGGLCEVARFYEREVNKMMKIMTSLLEPAIILVMGLIVAFIVLAMLLPVFEIGVGVG
jgi:general secretion pathway protein F